MKFITERAAFNQWFIYFHQKKGLEYTESLKQARHMVKVSLGIAVSTIEEELNNKYAPKA